MAVVNNQSNSRAPFNPSLGNFSCFPPEIRKIIFEFAIDDPHDEVDTQSGCDPPLLCLASRHIHRETIEMTQQVMRQPCQHYNFFYHLPADATEHIRFIDVFPQYPGPGWRGHAYKFVENRVRFIRQYAANDGPAPDDIASVTMTLGWPWGSEMQIHGGNLFDQGQLRWDLRYELFPKIVLPMTNLRIENERHLVAVARLLCRHIGDRTWRNMLDGQTRGVAD